MKTKSESINLSISTNFNNIRMSNIPKSKISLNNKNQENKENLNSNIKITNKKSYKKLRTTLQKQQINQKLNAKNNKIEKKIDLKLYQTANTRIFDPDAFNNTSIFYSKHKNKTTFINYYIIDTANSNPNRKINTQNYNNKKIQTKPDNNYKIIKNSITFSRNNTDNLKKNINENSKKNISTEKDSISNKNKLFSNNLAYNRYCTAVKNFKNNYHINKPKKHLSN